MCDKQNIAPRLHCKCPLKRSNCGMVSKCKKSSNYAIQKSIENDCECDTIICGSYTPTIDSENLDGSTPVTTGQIFPTKSVYTKNKNCIDLSGSMSFTLNSSISFFQINISLPPGVTIDEGYGVANGISIQTGTNYIINGIVEERNLNSIKITCKLNVSSGPSDYILNYNFKFQ